MPGNRNGLVDVDLGSVYVGSYARSIAAGGGLNIVCADQVNSDYECNCYAENGALSNAASPFPRIRGYMLIYLFIYRSVAGKAASKRNLLQMVGFFSMLAHV